MTLIAWGVALVAVAVACLLWAPDQIQTARASRGSWAPLAV